MDPNLTPSVPPEESGTGYLIVHVTTARGAIPLEGARVNVYRADESADPSTQGDQVAAVISGRDGNTIPIPLDTPPRENSESPGMANPYALYRISVFLDGYSGLIFDNVPIFEGITAIQPAILIPLPEGQSSNGYPTDSNMYFDGSNSTTL